MPPGMTIECWMLSNGQMMRKVEFNDGQSFASTNSEWAEAIKATEVLARLPTSVDEFQSKHPNAFVRSPALGGSVP